MSNLVCMQCQKIILFHKTFSREKTNGPLKVKNDSSGGREVFMLYWHEAIAKLNRERCNVYIEKSKNFQGADTISLCTVHKHKARFYKSLEFRRLNLLKGY